MLEKNSKQLWKSEAFHSVVKDFISNNNEVMDVLLFGSIVKGDESPKDIDLLIVFKDKKHFKLSTILKKKLGKIASVHITTKNFNELFDENFNAREAVLEAYSFSQGKFLSNSLGYSSQALFKYDITSLNKSKRMQFYYSLHGRKEGDPNMMQELNASKFSDQVLICPMEKRNRMRTYLEHWDMPFLEIPMFIPTRLIQLLRS